MDTIITNTDIKVAKLETAVDNIEQDIMELKQDIKVVHGRVTDGNTQIMEKLTSMTRDTNDQHSDILSRMDAMDRRINGRVSALERWKYWVIGASVIVAWLISYVPVHKFFS